MISGVVDALPLDRHCGAAQREWQRQNPHLELQAEAKS